MPDTPPPSTGHGPAGAAVMAPRGASAAPPSRSDQDLVACGFRGGGARKAAETFGENVAVTKHGIQIRISNLNSRDLSPASGCWPPKLKEHKGLAITSLAPSCFLLPSCCPGGVHNPKVGPPEPRKIQGLVATEDGVRGHDQPEPVSRRSVAARAVAAGSQFVLLAVRRGRRARWSVVVGWTASWLRKARSSRASWRWPPPKKGSSRTRDCR